MRGLGAEATDIRPAGIQEGHPIICLPGDKIWAYGAICLRMSWWRTRSRLSRQNGHDDSQYSSSAVDAYGGGEGDYHEPATGEDGNNRSPSRPKRSSSRKDYDGNNNYNGTYNSGGGGGYNGYGAGSGAPYNNGAIYSMPYYGGGGGAYNNSSSYGGNGDDGGYNNNSSSYGNGGYNNNTSSYGNGGDGAYNNNTSSYGNGGDGGYTGPWGPQDSARPPMYINTREVHFYGMPAGYDDDYNSDQRRRGGGGGGGGGGGFFRPALQAVGQFVDRKFGFNDRN